MVSRFIGFLSLLLLLSCRKDHSCETCQPSSEEIFMTVLWTGDRDADGCDWCLKDEDNIFYHPENLAEEFRQDNLFVRVRYSSRPDPFVCGIAGLELPVIHLESIRNQ